MTTTQRNPEAEALYQRWSKANKDDLDRRVDAALPLIKAMIEKDELHNPYVTMHNVLEWKARQRIWISEEMERHGFIWAGNAWRRTEEDRIYSLSLRYRPNRPLPNPSMPTKYPPEVLYGNKQTRLLAALTCPNQPDQTTQLSLFL